MYVSLYNKLYLLKVLLSSPIVEKSYLFKKLLGSNFKHKNSIQFN